MAQFDVYRNPITHQREAIPFVLDIQSELLDMLPTRLTMPLALPNLVPSAIPLSLCPQLDFEGQRVYALTQLTSAFRRRDLGKPIGSASSYASQIVAALDVVISGV